MPPYPVHSKVHSSRHDCRSERSSRVHSGSRVRKLYRIQFEISSIHFDIILQSVAHSEHRIVKSKFHFTLTSIYRPWASGSHVMCRINCHGPYLYGPSYNRSIIHIWHAQWRTIMRTGLFTDRGLINACSFNNVFEKREILNSALFHSVDVFSPSILLTRRPPAIFKDFPI